MRNSRPIDLLMYVSSAILFCTAKTECLRAQTADTPSIEDLQQQLNNKKAGISKKRKEAEDAQKQETERAAEVQRQEVFRRQHVTIECPVFDYNNSRFTSETYRLTLHLVDKSTGRLDQYGLYDWTDQKWSRFAGEDENYLWVYKNSWRGTGVHYWKEVEEKEGQYGTYHSTHHYQENSGTCYRWDKAIDKNSLKVTIIGTLPDKFTAASATDDEAWLCTNAPNASFRTSAQCISVGYAAPPERLGN